MATEDVPGFNPANRDQLATGCWAEHEDKSLIFVESTEGGRVVFSMFDLSGSEPTEYRHAMPESDFKKAFSWKSGEAVAGEKWTWHDKTPFDWDRVIKEGAKPGAKFTNAIQQISAAQKVAESLNLRAAAVDLTKLKPRQFRKLMKTKERYEGMLAKLGG